MSTTLRSSLLVLNAGSSSLKLAIFDGSTDRTVEGESILRAQVDRISDSPNWRLRGGTAPRATVPVLAEPGDQAAVLQGVLEWLDAEGIADGLVAVGHRIVHGGLEFATATRIDQTVLCKLDALVPLAPLHQPHGLAAVRAVLDRWPGLLQVACFDTAFHASQPQPARAYALPRACTDAGVIRYGFHGLSYQYIASVLSQHLPATATRVIVAHLGSGASLCALQAGASIATTMGFTPLDGLPMSTRCGSLDPGVVLYLLRERGMSLQAVEDLLSQQSGLLGVSGISGDMQRLLASDAAEADEAVELFCYRVNREIGSLVAALGGLDALVFTGGIGEHAASIRERICTLAGWSGLRFDAEANAAHGPRISAADSAVAALVIATDEERVIARQARQLVSGATR